MLKQDGVGTDDQAVVFVSGGPLVLDAYASVDNICQGEQSQLLHLPRVAQGTLHIYGCRTQQVSLLLLITLLFSQILLQHTL